MGPNSVHLFVFGSYSRRWLLRRSGSSSIRYDWMVEGEGGSDKAEQVQSERSHVQTQSELTSYEFMESDFPRTKLIAGF